jgi:CheY-like chemotaxis protein/PAS domain-containing protein
MQLGGQSKASVMNLRASEAADRAKALIESVLPVLLPLGVLLLQALLWDLIAPFAWLGFLPAVAAAAWFSGLRGGLLALAVSVASAEWLLTRPSVRDVEPPDSQIFAALTFSALALASVFLLESRRREQARLHAAVAALRALFLATEDADRATHATTGRGQTADDLAALERLHAELTWRKAAFKALPLPLAVYTPQGRCLSANPAFVEALGSTPQRVRGLNPAVPAAFGIDSLAETFQRVAASRDMGERQAEVIGSGLRVQLYRLASGDGGVVLLTLAVAATAPAAFAALRSVGDPHPPPAQASRASSGSGYDPPFPTLHARPAQPGEWPRAKTATLDLGRSLGGLHCLVVDDQQINRELLREILQIEGAQVSLCEGGREALERVNADPGTFDVVLMDLQMPDMDGYTAATQLRRRVGAEQLPIFAVTADGPGVTHSMINAAGMQGLLYKPLDVERLVGLLAAERARHRRER